LVFPVDRQGVPRSWAHLVAGDARIFARRLASALVVDPRQLERWWGPPTYPATFTKHDLAPGSRVEYRMTGPEGDQSRGYLEVLEADATHRLVFRDGFANADGTPNTDLPMNTIHVRIEKVGPGRTRMSIESVFPSAEAMEQVLGMGM
jgi:uncharacterized protein YndB with AHSA1/START domain